MQALDVETNQGVGTADVLKVTTRYNPDAIAKRHRQHYEKGFCISCSLAVDKQKADDDDQICCRCFFAKFKATLAPLRQRRLFE